MDFLKENAKAFAGALSTLLVLILKPFLPQAADPTFQPALEIVLGMAVVAASVWLIPNQPKPEVLAAVAAADRADRGLSPPLLALVFAASLLTLGACASQPVSPPETFSRACSSVGEAMVQVISLRRQGKMDDATYVAIDDSYDAAVTSCNTLPVGDTATAVALEKVNAFLLAASGVTGTTYQY